MSIASIVICLIVLFFVVGFIWLLLAPIRLIIDSYNNTYRIDYQGIGHASIIGMPEDIHLQYQLFFWKKSQSILALLTQPKKLNPSKRKSNKRTENKIKSRKTIRQVISLIRSFEVKQFSGTIDFGNCIQNAFLYPIFYWLGARKNQFPSINFLGKNEINLVIENRLIRIIYILLLTRSQRQ